MDRLPKRKDLIFEAARKTIYLRLTTVIRSLGTKFQNTGDQERIFGCIDRLRDLTGLEDTFKTKLYGRVFCIYDEIRTVNLFYQLFLACKNGDGRSTKRLRAGIARLEWLRDNWDDLEIVGDLKSGYRLELKNEKIS